MFCARCGEQIPDSSAICPQCGREASLNHIVAPSIPAPTTPAAEQFNTPLTQSFIPRRQQEVGGWLMFFCILLIVVVPVFVMAMAWSGDFGIEAMFNIAWAAFGVLVGAMLWNVHPRAFVLLWIYFGMTALIIVLTIVNLATAEEGATAHDSVLVFRGIIYFIAWFLYFKRSERVKATFGRNL
jgi:Protein of unknown function (DUF2569)/zinc-ribbon domain